ncbi:MAG: SLC45 family MFS transporter [Euryarchaeota archaeon]|nr:SLC45 family MFS transporter [Euryarchaeota archaeon]
MSSKHARKRNYSLAVALGLAFLGFSASTGWAINKGLTFPLLKEQYTNAPFIIGAVLSIQGIMGLFVPPIMGYLSDVSKSKRGRRTPFILVGGIFAALMILAVYFSYTTHQSLTVFAIVLSLFYFGMYSFAAQYRALMPDVVPSGARGKVSGMVTLFEWAGNLFLFGTIFIVGSSAKSAAGMDDSIAAMIKTGYFLIPFALVAIFLTTAALVIFFGIKEKHFPHKRRTEDLLQYIKDIIFDHDFVSFYLAQVLFWLSFELIAVFLFGILQSCLGEKDVTTFGNLLMALFNITVLVGAVVGGPLYDRIGRKKSIIIGGLIFLIPFLYGWFANTKTDFTALMALAGIGWGMLLATSWPVVGDLLTKYEREEYNGRYYGIFEATKSFPILIAGLFGGAIVQAAGGNYKVLFPIGAISIIIALPLIWKMKHLGRGKQ